MGRVYGEIAEYMQEQSIPFAGAPYALYRNMDMDALDIEIGFPVPAPAVGTDTIKPAKIPGGKAVVAMHTGPYSELSRTYTQLMGYLEHEQLKPTGLSYEFYLNDPNVTPPENLQTEIVFPLQE